MRLLVVGSGGREHSLVKKLSEEVDVSEIVCAPGNAAISQEQRTRITDVDVSDASEILKVAEKEGVDFTIVGPELPLANGVADTFSAARQPLFGPSKGAAKLESSKAFSKEFMKRHGVPTASFEVCNELSHALDVLASGRFGFPVVVKADGLAAGKGVTVARDRAEAEAAVSAARVERRFGSAGTSIVLEECLTGPEVSYFVITDGKRHLALASAQDHKRAFDGDEGPNTGGMGAFAPSPIFSVELENTVVREIVTPTLNGMRLEGSEYRGVLYVGLMLTHDGPQVIEFNVRFGDPEAQVVLPMIESDLAPVLFSAAAGDLGDCDWRLRRDPHVGVVMASGGYPGSYEVGFPIAGLERATSIPGVHVVHAGTALKDDAYITKGGRVLTVVSRGSSYGEAVSRAYEAVGLIDFQGSHVRTDIGQKALS